MTTANIYLTFSGNCREAFDFYKSVLGGDFSYSATFGEMPQEGMPPMPDSEKEKIMHIALPISNETVIMGSDSPEAFGSPVTAGNNFSISLQTETTQEADRIFKELSVGGEVIMPLEKMFWGDYFGQFVDKFGIGWMVNVDLSGDK